MEMHVNATNIPAGSPSLSINWWCHYGAGNQIFRKTAPLVQIHPLESPVWLKRVLYLVGKAVWPEKALSRPDQAQVALVGPCVALNGPFADMRGLCLAWEWPVVL